MRVLTFNFDDMEEPPMFTLRFIGCDYLGGFNFVAYEITADEYLQGIPWIFNTRELAPMLESGEAEIVFVSEGVVEG